MTLIADVFPKLGTAKDVVRQMSENFFSEDPPTGNIVNGPKHLWNLNDMTVIFINHCEENWVGKCRS